MTGDAAPINSAGEGRRSFLVWSTTAVQLSLAAAAMVATLPGRTHGLGLITEPLLADVGLSRTDYAQLNLWGTGLGALFCLPAGYLIDAWGVRRAMASTLALFGASVALFAVAEQTIAIGVLLTLSRGLGQSALSVASIAMVGKLFPHRLSSAMAAYSVLVTVGFMFAFGAVGPCVVEFGWRTTWLAMAAAIAGLGLASLLLARGAPIAERSRDASPSSEQTPPEASFTLTEALSTRAFWLVAGATSLFALASSGLGLFNESILTERGFSRSQYHQTLVLSTFVGLFGQMACGLAAARWSHLRLLGVSMFIYTFGFFGLTIVSRPVELYACASLLGFAGGMLTVIFFAVWPRLFGRQELGRIQGAAQMATVLASAAGPVLFAECFQWRGSYVAALYGVAAAVAVFAIECWRTPCPAKPQRSAIETGGAAASA